MNTWKVAHAVRAENKYAAYKDLPYLYLPEVDFPAPLNFILTAGQNYHMPQA